MEDSYSSTEVCMIYVGFISLWMFIGRIIVPSTFKIFFEKSVEPARANQYTNLMTSLLHALISCSWGYVIFERDFRQHINNSEDYARINQFTKGVYAKSSQLVGINTLSYFMYDTVDYYQKLGSVAKNWDMYLHHAIVFLLFIPATMNWALLPIATYSLQIEFSNVFLHTRRLMLWSGHTKDSRIYKINFVALIITFFALRMYMVWVGTGAVFNFWRNFDSYEIDYPLPAVFPFCCYFVINIINLVMFVQLYKSDFKKNSVKKLKKSGMSWCD